MPPPFSISTPGDMWQGGAQGIICFYDEFFVIKVMFYLENLKVTSSETGKLAGKADG